MKAVNLLKMKVSYGHLGYAGDTDFFSIEQIGDKDKEEFKPSTGANTTDLIRLGNPDLKWEYSNELNIGIEGRFLNNRLSGEVNYFRELRKNIIGINSAKYATIGEISFLLKT